MQQNPRLANPFGTTTNRVLRRQNERSRLDGSIIGRSRAERSLDKMFQDQREFVKDLTPPPAPKRKLESNEPVKTEADAPAEKKTKREPQSVESVLARLAVHAKRPAKFEAVLRLLQKLLESQALERDNFMDLLKVLQIVALQSPLGDVARPLLLGLFKTHVELFVEDAGPFRISAEERAFLAVLSLSAVGLNNLYTDDNFQFFQSIERLEALLDEVLSFNLPIVKTETETPAATTDGERNRSDGASGEGPTASAQDVKLEDVDVKDEAWTLPDEAEIKRIKTDILLRSLPIVFSFASVPWARTGVERFFQKVYIKRMCFPEQQQSEIANWQTQLKTRKKELPRGAAILRIGESANPVVDGREEKVFASSGANTWSMRQLGL